MNRNDYISFESGTGNKIYIPIAIVTIIFSRDDEPHFRIRFPEWSLEKGITMTELDETDINEYDSNRIKRLKAGR